MKKFLLIGTIILMILAVMFWAFFAIISSRRFEYVFDCKKSEKIDDEILYYTKNDVKYYTNSIEEIEVSKLKFIFKTDRKSLKEYIEDDEMRSIMKYLNVYRYYFNQGLETKYYNSDKNFVITKCEYYNNTNYYEYHINDEYVKVECNRYSSY